MQGSVVQVNISNGGVPKYPVLQAHLTPHGVEGDRHNNTQIHGGPRQAVLLIAAGAAFPTRGLTGLAIVAAARSRGPAALTAAGSPFVPAAVTCVISVGTCGALCVSCVVGLPCRLT